MAAAAAAAAAATCTVLPRLPLLLGRLSSTQTQVVSYLCCLSGSPECRWAARRLGRATAGQHADAFSDFIMSLSQAPPMMGHAVDTPVLASGGGTGGGELQQALRRALAHCAPLPSGCERARSARAKHGG